MFLFLVHQWGAWKVFLSNVANCFDAEQTRDEENQYERKGKH